MKGNFSRFTFDPLKHYSAVFMQQGRVQLDADWNEQQSILLHNLRTLVADLIGPHGGPIDNCGFGVEDIKRLNRKERARLKRLDLLPHRSGDFLIGAGHYYVDGILCENGVPSLYSKQPDYSPDLLKQGAYIAYLDVWERHITCLEDPSIREVALGGPDTATRSKVVWQVKVVPLIIDSADVRVRNTREVLDTIKAQWHKWKRRLQPESRGLLKVRAKTPARGVTDPGTTSRAGYRGLENQLYRIEIHQGTDLEGHNIVPTFKWSRHNGSVVAAWLGTYKKKIVVGDVRDQSHDFARGQWIELIHDDLELGGLPGTLVQLVKVEGNVLTINPATASGDIEWREEYINAKARRWDQQETGRVKLDRGGVPIVEGAGNRNWITLENGIEIQFQRPARGQAESQYCTGDYWLIPARTATGNVEWPTEIRRRGPLPLAVPPHGVEHHLVPIAAIIVDEQKCFSICDLRHKFSPLGACKSP